MALYTIAVVIVSDTAFSDPSKDRCIPAIESVVSQSLTCARIISSHFVPDEKNKIEDLLKRLIDCDAVDFVITSGGTGFGASEFVAMHYIHFGDLRIGPRDITPEATLAVIDRQAASISTLIMTRCLQITPLAALSRAVCGIRGKAIILNLPGSPKGARECLESAVDVLPHAMRLLRTQPQPHSVPHFTPAELGQTSTNTSQSSPIQPIQHEKKVANLVKLQQCCDCGVSHDEFDANKSPHENQMNQPLSMTLHNSVAHRPRKSPFSMVSVPYCVQIIYDTIKPLESVSVAVGSKLLGLVATYDIFSPTNIPSVATSIKDGYAINTRANGDVFRVLASSTAGGSSATSLQSDLELGNGIVRVTTGAPIPQYADAVVMVEHTELVDTILYKTEGLSVEEEKTVRILKKPRSGQDIRQVGVDVQHGQLLISSGTSIGPGEIGLLVSVGVKAIEVYKRPKVAVISTGDELIDSTEAPNALHQVRDSNRPMLIACLEKLPVDVIDGGIIKDRETDLEKTLLELSKTADIIVTSGGVSMGELDLMKPILQRNGNIHFGRVNMKPGKPTTYATLTSGQSDKKTPVFCLPGNPVSSFVTFYLFVYPAIRGLLGHQSRQLPCISVKVLSDLSLDAERPEYHRATVSWSTVSGSYEAISTGTQDSSRLLSTVNAEALLILPQASESKNETIIKSGEHVSALMLPFFG